MKTLIAALAFTALMGSAANAQSHGFSAPHPSQPGPDNTVPAVRPDVGRVYGHTGADFDRHENDFSHRNIGERDFGNRPVGHHDVQNFSGTPDAERRLSAEPWQPPKGYKYRRWTSGEHLPALYFAPKITRFGLYGLTVPPPGAEWIRSGPDALLINRKNGEIIRAQYGAFH
jgi:Ni/Co efflux regulator RcnB